MIEAQTEPRALDIYGPKKKRKRARTRAKLIKESRRRLNETEQEQRALNLPGRQYGRGGKREQGQLFGLRNAVVPGVPSTAHTSATAYPFVAGPSLGLNGVWIGEEVHGGGAFLADPWALYEQGLISGMSMLLFGTVGSGKSSLAKSWCMRLVLAGRKLSVPSDLKGEWTPVVLGLGGAVIQVAPGLSTRLNPLDEGKRPGMNSQGVQLRDQEWASIVQQRRSMMLVTIVKIIRGNRELDDHEAGALRRALMSAEALAKQEDRQPLVPDVRKALIEMVTAEKSMDEMRRAADRLQLALETLETGELAGMFDGPSTEQMDGSLPAVAIDTSAVRYASPVASRIVSACCGAWMEAMISEDDGQRIVVYEEGWDSISNDADLERMMKGWKLARHYGVFNILILHKVTDLDTAGGQGSRQAAMAQSLLADADIKVIYRQDRAAMRATNDKLELSPEEQTLLINMNKGRGLWRVKNSTFEVDNILTEAEKPILDTDQRMGKDQENTDVGVGSANVADAPSPAREWL